MIVTPLATHSSRAVRDILHSHGWDQLKAESAASGLDLFAVYLSDLDASVLPTLVSHAGRLGLEVLTGDDWAVVSGSKARMGALARPWVVPPELAAIAQAIGEATPPESVSEWLTARGAVSLLRPVIVGILNVTPDSFSDGGQFDQVGAALAQADRLMSEGAMIVDVGGESTRPGRPEQVSEEEEVQRVLPVIEGLVSRHPSLLISIDTVKAAVAVRALEAGAAIINDVSALRLDPLLAPALASTGAGVVLMHSRGNVSTMATLDHAEYAPDVVTAVREELLKATQAATSAGIGIDRIVLDPGIGFAKTGEHNLLLLDRLSVIGSLGRPLLVGPSRKRFLGSVTGREVSERDVATAAACLVAYERGARLFRVHNVALTRDALAVGAAVRGEQ